MKYCSYLMRSLDCQRSYLLHSILSAKKTEGLGRLRQESSPLGDRLIETHLEEIYNWIMRTHCRNEMDVGDLTR